MSMYLNLLQISGVIGVILKNTNFRNYKPIAVYIKVVYLHLCLTVTFCYGDAVSVC